MKSFKEVFAVSLAEGLPEALEKAVNDLHFETPTPIQAAAIPVAISGKDLMGCAQTGSGKTVAFTIPLIIHLLKNPKNRVLILTPTRELAAQVAEVVLSLTKYATHLRSALLIGGARMGGQIRALSRDPAILIATPGRLIDHMDQGYVDLRTTDMVVLDEADRMLDMGFATQIECIFKSLPIKRQTLLFSATLPREIIKLASRFMNEPERVNVAVGASVKAPDIKQRHLELPGDQKNPRILQELQARTGQVLVFARTKQRTDRLARYLKENGIKVAAIHGGRTQSQRNMALKGFRDGYYPVLVATDVASRGLDIPMIELVVNFDLPQTAEDYTHRIGRTARAGASGEALSFVTPDEMSHWRSLIRVGEPRGGSPRPQFGRGGRSGGRPQQGGRGRGGYQGAGSHGPGRDGQNNGGGRGSRPGNRGGYILGGPSNQRDGQRDGQRGEQRSSYGVSSAPRFDSRPNNRTDSRGPRSSGPSAGRSSGPARFAGGGKPSSGGWGRKPQSRKT